MSTGSTTPLEHYVSPEPFEPLATEKLTPEQERFYRESQWKIMWWKFRRHRIAVEVLRENAVDRLPADLRDQARGRRADQVIARAYRLRRIDELAQARVDVRDDRANVAQFAAEKSDFGNFVHGQHTSVRHKSRVAVLAANCSGRLRLIRPRA